MDKFSTAQLILIAIALIAVTVCFVFQLISLYWLCVMWKIEYDNWRDRKIRSDYLLRGKKRW